MKIIRSIVCLFVFALLLSSCGSGIPDDKKSYVGSWTSDEMSLYISAQGRVEYKRENRGSGGTRSVKGPIQKFEGDNFIVGAFGINTTFTVSATPHTAEDGLTKMTVDGVELVKE